MRIARRRFLAGFGIVVAAVVVTPSAATSLLRAQGLPAQYTDQEFWKLSTDVSEPGGYFRSDNFLSNETGFQMVIPELKRETKPGGVYLGVGPEQNFTYIVNLQPRLAVIFDIRRQNVILHLMYKALMEMSPDRADFLSRLFSRARPSGLDTSSTAAVLFAAYENVGPDHAAYVQNLAAIKDWLVKKHGFALGDSDMASLDYVYSAFYGGGPEINYSYSPNGMNGGFGGGRGGRGGGGGGMPSYSTIQGYSNDGNGNNLAYLATEANYRWIRDFETKNLLIPVVGDFAGQKAIRAVAQYLKDHDATVTAFYLSNVEQYLFMQGNDWSNFYKNVLTLPVDSASTFIRSNGSGGGRGGCGGGYAGGGFAGGRGGSGGMVGPNLLASISDQAKAFREGRLNTYCDVLSTSHY